MAIYENLPVYKASYDLLLLIFQTIKIFPREYKYSLWDKIKNETIDLISNIYKANISKDKRQIILNWRWNIEVIRLYIRICKDLKIISLSRFIDLNLLIESISKQLTSWGKSQKKY